MPHPGYYKRIREICDAYDVLFVADEVLCGYGRTGLPFAIAAWERRAGHHYAGKSAGQRLRASRGHGGFATGCGKPSREGTGRFVHGLTYSGTPMACFVGLKVNEIMQREGLFTRAATIGEGLKARLHALAERHEIIGEVRGRGLLLGLEFVADRERRQPFPRSAAVTERIVKSLRDNDVIVAAGVPLSNFGKDGDHIQISPPFTISESEADSLVEALDTAITAVEAEGVCSAA